MLRPSRYHESAVTADGSPHPGSRVSIVAPRRRGVAYLTELLAFETADGEGRVGFVLPAGEDPPAIVASVTRSAQAFPRVSTMPETVELDAGWIVHGQAVNQSGEPIPFARISGRSWIPEGFGLMQRHLGVAGPDGRFRLSGLAAGDASFRASDGNVEFHRALQIDGPVDLGTIVLKNPEAIWVRIVERERGRPVLGASIQIGGGPWLQTDSGGLVRLAPTGSRALLVHRSGFLPAQLDVPVGAGRASDEPFHVALQPAFNVRGVFLAADGVTPASSGRITAQRKVGQAAQTQFGLMKSDGSFSLDLEAGTYHLELAAGNAGLERLEVSGVAGETRDLGVVMAPASAWVSGQVVSSEFEPVAAEVLHIPPSESGWRMVWALGRTSIVETNAEGHFELRGLEVGRSTLRIEAAGFAPAEFEVEAEGLEWIDAGVIELSRGRRVVVRSDAERGLVVLDPGARGRLRDEKRAPLRDGEAVFEHVPAGRLAVRVLESGLLVCQREVEGSDGQQAVRCNRNVVRVSGRVTIGGRVGDGALLWRQAVEQEDTGVIRTLGGALPRSQIFMNPADEQQATIDTAGRYRIAAVLPGRWEVIWAPLAGGAQEVREVRVPAAPGREVVIDFDYAGVSLEGQVTHEDGLPAFPASVEIFPLRTSVMTDRDGRFRFLGLAPGTYQVQARLRSRRSRLSSVDLARMGDRQTLHLVLEVDAASEELVIETSGATGFCFVESSAGSFHVKRIRAGTARIRLDPPLPTSVRAACQIDGRWAFDGWGNLDSALERGVRLEASESTASIVLLGESSPSPRIRVRAPGGWELGRLRQWLGGAAVFSVGETLDGLPAGEYTLRWSDRNRVVHASRRRVTEVEIAD